MGFFFETLQKKAADVRANDEFFQAALNRHVDHTPRPTLI